MRSILLVEDDPDVRELLENVLSDAGYAVTSASNVQEGLHALNGYLFDLLLTDGRLPDGTGIELADTAYSRGIPVLILTGYAFILRNANKHRVLLKPMRPKEIVAAVEEELLGRSAPA